MLHMFILPISRSINTVKYLKLLLRSKINNVFILDLNYHKTTVYFLRKLSILTIGPVPITTNIKNLDIAIPIGNDNIFSQFFFIKTIVHLKKVSEYNKYLLYIKIWENFRTNLLLKVE